jgi:hypothetical protein
VEGTLYAQRKYLCSEDLNIGDGFNVCLVFLVNQTLEVDVCPVVQNVHQVRVWVNESLFGTCFCRIVVCRSTCIKRQLVVYYS